MQYFSNFPKVNETINGKSKNLVNILCAPDIFPEESETAFTSNEVAIGVGDLAHSIYEDANNFWAIMYANDSINPWTIGLEDESEFKQNNANYFGYFAKYTTAPKLDPNCYVEFKSGDIIVPVVNGLGYTSAQDVFADYNLLGTSSSAFPAWVVNNFFEDTKKAKITPVINIGGTASTDEYPPVGSGFFVLRKGNTGYYPIENSYNPTQRTVDGLTSYQYTKSPATFQKINEPSKVLSPATIIARTVGNLDTLLTVASANAPLSAGLSAYTEYNITTTDLAFTKQQAAKSSLTYVKENYLRLILQSVT